MLKLTLLNIAVITYCVGCSCESSSVSNDAGNEASTDGRVEAGDASNDGPVSIDGTCRLEPAPTPLCTDTQCPVVSERWIRCSMSGFGVTVANASPHPFVTVSTNRLTFRGHLLSGAAFDSETDPCGQGITQVVSDPSGSPRLFMNTADSRELATCVRDAQGAWTREVIPTPAAVDFPLARSGWTLSDGTAGVLFGADGLYLGTRQGGLWSNRQIAPVTVGRSVVHREGDLVSMAYWIPTAATPSPARELWAMVGDTPAQLLWSEPGNLDSNNPISLTLRGDQNVPTVSTNDPQNGDELVIASPGNIIRVPDTIETQDFGCDMPDNCTPTPACTEQGYSGIGSVHALARLSNGELAIIYAVRYVDADVDFELVCSEPGCICNKRVVADRGYSQLRITRISENGTRLSTPLPFRLTAIPEALFLDQEGDTIELVISYQQSQGPLIQVLRLDASMI